MLRLFFIVKNVFILIDNSCTYVLYKGIPYVTLKILIDNDDEHYIYIASTYEICDSSSYSLIFHAPYHESKIIPNPISLVTRF